ncbi:MAG: serine hydrolase domain-containing protein, partial [Limisphaerales bacterium]
YVWRDAFENKASAGHTSQGRIPEQPRSIYKTGNSAFTLYTTPSDYARFLLEMMREDRTAKQSLDAKWLQAMLTPSPVSAVATNEEEAGSDGADKVTFGLGWRVDSQGGAKRVFHSGSNRTGFRCYAEFYPEKGSGIVIMANAAGGNNLWAELMKSVKER